MVAGYKPAEELGAWVTDKAVEYVETNEPHERVTEAEFKSAKLLKELEASRSNKQVYEMPLTPIVGGAADSGKTGVKDSGPEGETKLLPGWIDGDAILPPFLRTGANVGGAKGNDGVDWAHSRRAATNPSPEEEGGGGGEGSYIQREGKNSLIGQPKPDDGAGGGSTARHPAGLLRTAAVRLTPSMAPPGPGRRVPTIPGPLTPP